MQIDFRAADCRWEQGKPDELHVTPHKTDEGKQLVKDLTELMGQTVSCDKSYSKTRYLIVRKVGSVFVLVKADGRVR